MRLYVVLLWLAVVAAVLRAEASMIVQSAPDAADLLLFDANKNVEFTKRALRSDGAKNEERWLSGSIEIRGALVEGGSFVSEPSEQSLAACSDGPKEGFQCFTSRRSWAEARRQPDGSSMAQVCGYVLGQAQKQ
ncbi:hypothetical protein PF008_g28228 [Phytophthora fragariae]|uniref:RxLR effector protein n=1 Tax=Phytophthora fragariae TaxID=53985 RepID=A0A6G0QBW1_9STRA|nr:hypothetical protein PF008_g28228 [Phytophthora fragariae]